MTVTYYQYTGEINRLDKTAHLTSLGSASGVPVAGVDVVHPSVLIEGAVPAGANYAHIDTFSRYYWIREITRDTNAQSVLQLDSDPLYTFQNQIRACSAICLRSEQQYNADYPDPDYMREQSYEIQTKLLGSLNTYEESALVPDKIYCFFVP